MKPREGKYAKSYRMRSVNLDTFSLTIGPAYCTVNAHGQRSPAVKPDLTRHLGKHVSMQIDRPLGSTHPREPDIHYPINYGFVPGTVSGDGSEIDAYVLGVEKPIEVFSGMVIAIIVRDDDLEDKLVVAPDGTMVTREEIAAAVYFQEQFFISRVVMQETPQLAGNGLTLPASSPVHL